MKYIKAIKISSFIGFGIIIVILWLDEILDLPYLFLNAQPTPVNYKEAILETFFVIIVMVVFTLISRKLEKHIKYLEGLTSICASCKKIRFENKWTPIEQWLSQKSDVVLSHGICNECMKKLYPDVYKKLEEKDKIVVE